MEKKPNENSERNSNEDLPCPSEESEESDKYEIKTVSEWNIPNEKKEEGEISKIKLSMKGSIDTDSEEYYEVGDGYSVRKGVENFFYMPNSKIIGIEIPKTIVLYKGNSPYEKIGKLLINPHIEDSLPPKYIHYLEDSKKNLYRRYEKFLSIFNMSTLQEIATFDFSGDLRFLFVPDLIELRNQIICTIYLTDILLINSEFEPIKKISNGDKYIESMIKINDDLIAILSSQKKDVFTLKLFDFKKDKWEEKTNTIQQEADAYVPLTLFKIDDENIYCIIPNMCDLRIRKLRLSDLSLLSDVRINGKAGFIIYNNYLLFPFRNNLIYFGTETLFVFSKSLKYYQKHEYGDNEHGEKMMAKVLYLENDLIMVVDFIGDPNPNIYKLEEEAKKK